MTDEQWEMIQKTPEYKAERAAYSKRSSKLRRKLEDRHDRTEQAMYERHKREYEARRVKRQKERDELAEVLYEEENEGLRRVFAKYGLEPGR